MSPLLIALLGVLLLPLFVSTWRTSLLGLLGQGLLMAWIAYRMMPTPLAASDWVTLADLVLVRGLGAPIALYWVLRSQKTTARSDVIPPNLLSWTFAFGVVLVSFNFAELLVPEHGDARTIVAVATSGIMLGFLVLATQAGSFGQIVGALRIENGIALLDLGGERHAAPMGIQIGQILVVAITIGFYRWYLASLAPGPPTAPDGGVERPAL